MIIRLESITTKKTAYMRSQNIGQQGSGTFLGASLSVPAPASPLPTQPSSKVRLLLGPEKKWKLGQTQTLAGNTKLSGNSVWLFKRKGAWQIGNTGWLRLKYFEIWSQNKAIFGALSLGTHQCLTCLGQIGTWWRPTHCLHWWPE